MQKRVSNRDARGIIERRESFETHSGSLWGAQPIAAGPGQYGGSLSMGSLPGEWQDRLNEAWERAGQALYVVYSYRTPIAWWDGERWSRPDVRYSPTTSKHQGSVPLDGSR